ncbi:hypothetical protein NE573_24670, partial [Parabacteroides distasonis]|nr:hypothetical protein [Parabacteroides distasonis]
RIFRKSKENSFEKVIVNIYNLQNKYPKYFTDNVNFNAVLHDRNSVNDIYEFIYEIISKELEEGRSWLRIRNQAPCNTCFDQWFCPSPSNYEIAIGR